MIKMGIEAYIKKVATRDTAVYWASPTMQAGGYNAFATPVEIDCFWVESTELVRTDDGREIMSKAKVYVTQDLDEQGMLFHGTLSDLTSSEKSDPREVAAAYEIMKFEKKPSLHIPNQYMRVAIIGGRRG